MLAEKLLAGELTEAAATTDAPPEKLAGDVAGKAAQVFEETARERRRIAELRARLIRARQRRWLDLTGVVVGALFLGVPVAVSLGVPNSVALSALVASASTVIAASVLLRRREGSEGRSRAGASQEAESLAEHLEAARGAYESALRAAVLSLLSERIDQELGELYEPFLPALDPGSLAEIDDLERQVPTKSLKEIEDRIDLMPGGSIGISGPRGVGKTTLIQHLATTANDGAANTGIVVDAPVDYDGREFVLHIFAKLCEATLGPEQVAALRGWDRSFNIGVNGSGRFGWFRQPYPPILGPLLLGLAGLLYISILSHEGKLHDTDLEPWALGLTAFGGFLTYMTVLMNPTAVRRFISRLRPQRRPDGNPIATAELRLRQIWFQQTFSTGWSGALQLPLGVKAGAEKSIQLAENQLSFPDVVSLYREFVSLLAGQGGRVCIGIDELDKMDDERARRFLNEIKVVFRSSGCYYLVSISEDAMSYFERRGLPFRDVFDSSFDDVLQMDYLPFEASRRMLRRRVVGLPVQFACLCHALGAGLPRDVIRAARSICEHDTGATLSAVVDGVCAKQIKLKRDAARIAVRRLREPTYVLLLSRWLRELEGATTADALLEKCRRFDADFVNHLGSVPGDPEGDQDHRESSSIALEVIAFCYFMITVREFISGLESESQTKRAVATGAVEELAKARQAFTFNPDEAWILTSRFRDRHLGKQPLPAPAA